MREGAEGGGRKRTSSIQLAKLDTFTRGAGSRWKPFMMAKRLLLC